MPVAGILPVIPTPFHDGRFDAVSLQRLLKHMLPTSTATRCSAAPARRRR